uniref:Ig-like domain-containing protein n=1 Tax=Romanomermis culicivorax TaxID=13658 RepID=A0A915HT50_ROMCU
GARECYLDHRGEVVCKSCPPGYFGPHCRECAEGYVPDHYDPRRCRPLGRIDQDRRKIYGGRPLTVRVDPDRQEVEEGSQISFRCTSSDPQARLSWYGPNNQLPPNTYERQGEIYVHNVRQEHTGAYRCLAHAPNGQTATGSRSLPRDVYESQGTLNFYDVRPEHAGHYQCVGSTPSGQSAQDNAALELTPKGAEPLAVRIRDPKNVEVEEGGTATLRCEALNKHEERGGTLVLYGVNREDAGTYVCTGTIPGEEAKDEGSVQVQPKQEPFRVKIRDPTTQRVFEGATVSYVCEVVKPYATHVEAVQPIFLSSCSKVTDDCYALLIRSFVSQCILSIDAQRRGISSNVPPKVSIKPKQQKVDPGENAEFVCTATGHPEPQITWIEEDKAQLGDNVKDDGKGRLSISGAQALNAGRYVCVAGNVAGEDRDTATLDVAFGDLILIVTPSGDENGKIVVAHEGPVKVECIAKVSPGMPEPNVEWIYDIGPSRGDVPDGYTPMEKHGRFISVEAATEHNEGKYTCRGTSGNITKEITVEIDVLPRQKRDVVIEGPAVREVTIGESVTLTCKLKNNYASKEKSDGSKEPMVTEDDLRWIRVSGGSMPETDALDEEPPPGILKIEHFEAGMAGEYECQLQSPEDPDVVLGSKRVRLV